jgi:hypothetical protein
MGGWMLTNCPPRGLAPTADSGDLLDSGDARNKAMADAVNLNILIPDSK